jgi:hypothetical protein
MIKKRCNTTVLLLFCLFMVVPSTACLKKKSINGKAHIEFRWRPHFSSTGSGWLQAHGDIVNRGSKRAEWVKVTIYTLDDKTGVVLDKVSQYITDGSGPNGRGLNPGEVVHFNIRLDSKKKQHYKYERAVTWSESM